MDREAKQKFSEAVMAILEYAGLESMIEDARTKAQEQVLEELGIDLSKLQAVAFVRKVVESYFDELQSNLVTSYAFHEISDAVWAILVDAGLEDMIENARITAQEQASEELGVYLSKLQAVAFVREVVESYFDGLQSSAQPKSAGEVKDAAKQDGALIRSDQGVSDIESEIGAIKKTLDSVLNVLEKLSNSANTLDQSNPVTSSPDHSAPTTTTTLKQYKLFDVQNRYAIAEGYANPVASPGAIVHGRPMQEYERKVFVLCTRDATQNESLYLGNQGSASTIGQAVGEFVVWPIYLMREGLI